MESSLTRVELRQELTNFLHTEVKQVFEQVLRSQLHQEISQYASARTEHDRFSRRVNDAPQLRLNRRSTPNDLCLDRSKSLELNAVSASQSAGLQESSHYTSLVLQASASMRGASDEFEVVSPMMSQSVEGFHEAGSEWRERANRMHRAQDLAEVDALIEHDVEMSQDLFHEYLASFSGLMVLLNATCLGCETNYRIHDQTELPIYFSVLELIFCIFFVIEITLRVVENRHGFFHGDDKLWNLFDLAIVTLQVIEQLSTLIETAANMRGLRTLRLLRIIRVIRLVRVLHLFEELHFIVASLTKTLSVVFWFSLVVFLMVYLFSILLLEIVIEAHAFDTGQDSDVHQAHLKYWFGTVPRAILTMVEAIAGGVSWDECLHVLSKSSWVAVSVFIVYIVIAMLAVLNMLTGLFVDRSMKMVKEERDFHVAAKIHNAFLKDNHTEIDLQKFRAVVQDDAMLDYLEELGLNSNACDDLFHLLDDDQSGYLSSSEIVDGCLRLRGHARAVDLALVMYEIRMLKSAFVQGGQRSSITL